MTTTDGSIKKLTRSEAKLAYWKNIPTEERSNRARAMAIAKNRAMTFEERQKHSQMMVAARRNKS